METITVIIPTLRYDGKYYASGFALSFEQCPCGGNCPIDECLEEIEYIHEVEYRV